MDEFQKNREAAREEFARQSELFKNGSAPSLEIGPSLQAAQDAAQVIIGSSSQETIAARNIHDENQGRDEVQQNELRESTSTQHRIGGTFNNPARLVAPNNQRASLTSVENFRPILAEPPIVFTNN